MQEKFDSNPKKISTDALAEGIEELVEPANKILELKKKINKGEKDPTIKESINNIANIAEKSEIVEKTKESSEKLLDKQKN